MSRVKVWNGDKYKYLGEGVHAGQVTVYFMSDPNNPMGSLQSFSNAETKPTPDQIPAGMEVIESPDNPKLVLDWNYTHENN